MLVMNSNSQHSSVSVISFWEFLQLLLLSLTKLSLFVFTPVYTSNHSRNLLNRKESDSIALLPGKLHQPWLPRQRLLSRRAKGSTRAILPSQHLVSPATVPSTMEWLTGWARSHISVSGNNDRSSETSLKPEHHGLTFSKLVYVGRLKRSSSNFQWFLSWTRMK